MPNAKNKDNEQWLELCEYVKKEILEYDDNMKFPQYLALKLQGIKRGEHIANNNHMANANYDDYTILCTFKLCRKKIVEYLHENEKRIHDEKHRINIVIKMIELEINDVYLRIQAAEKTKLKVERQAFDNQLNKNAEYVKKTKEINEKMKKIF
jgi:hypothetical protein